MASALIHTGCIKLRNAMVVGMESDLFNDSLRIKQKRRDLEIEDLDQCQVKKRRKQSKPVRIASIDSVSEDNDLRSWNTEGLNLNKNYSNQNLFDEETKIDQYPLNLSYVKEPVLVDSGDSCTSQNEEKKRKKKDKNSYQICHVGSQNQTYGRSQFFPNSLLLRSQLPPSALPVRRVMINNDSLRIFNPEAFCDLCNKEFCNKYFLKTHRANKHGIYSDCGSQVSGDSFSYLNSNPPPTSPQPSKSKALSSPAKISNGNIKALCNICLREFCNKYFVRRHKAKIHGIIEPNSDDGQEKFNIHYKTEDASQASQTDDVPNPVGRSTENFYFFNRETSSVDQSSPSQEHVKEERTEEDQETEPKTKFPSWIDEQRTKEALFCDICNKECCNKMFLNNHKKKCHGVLDSESEKPLMPLNLTRKEQLEKSEETSEPIVNFSSHFPFVQPPVDIKTPEVSKSIQLTTRDNFDDLKKEEQVSKNDKATESNLQFRENELTSQELLEKNQKFLEYFCEYCRFSFKSSALLESHIVKDHPSLCAEDSESERKTAFENVFLQSDVPENVSDAVEKPDPDHQFSGISSFNGERSIVTPPTSSFCEICKKELCNKYFMKTHMQRMHGISIENGAQIGGVVCDICNKELCSKYFLRVHKQNSHGIADEGFLPQVSDGKSEGDGSLRPGDTELSHRYFSHFTEVCVICNRRFRSTKWLKAHLLNEHGEEGKEKWKEIQPLIKSDKETKSDQDFYKTDEDSTDFQKKEAKSDANDFLNSILSKSTPNLYYCSFCAYSTPLLALLIVHETTHTRAGSNPSPLSCSICLISFENSKELDSHMKSHQQNSKPDSILQTNKNTEELKENVSDTENKASQINCTYLKCNKCPFSSSQIDDYFSHLRNEHSSGDLKEDYCNEVKNALIKISRESLIPATFALPADEGNYKMQSFVLEDEAEGPNTSNLFLSSLVFLPVKKRLDRPITASFKLTPT